MGTIHFLLNSQYKLSEFHYYWDNNNINIIELLIDTDDLDFIEENFSNTFVIENDKQNFLFSDYELSEYYPTDSGVKVICIK